MRLGSESIFTMFSLIKFQAKLFFFKPTLLLPKDLAKNDLDWKSIVQFHEKGKKTERKCFKYVTKGTECI